MEQGWGNVSLQGPTYISIKPRPWRWCRGAAIRKPIAAGLGGALLIAGMSGVTLAAEVQTDKQAVASATCQEADVTLHVVGTGEPTVNRNPIDLMIVFDRSGSMDDAGGNPVEPISSAKTAAKSLVDELDVSIDRAGLVSFSSSATENRSLLSTFAQVKTSIDGLTASGNTNIGDGVFDAQAEFAQNGRGAPAVRVMVVLSDGVANRAQNGTDCATTPTAPTTCTIDAVNQATTAKAAGTVVYTIGLNLINLAPATQTVARSTLQAMASSTDKYFEAPTIAELQGVFDAIATSITNIAGTNVVITDILPADVHYIPGSAVPAPTSVDGQTLTWNLGIISIGDDEVVTFRVSLDPVSANQLVDVYPDSRVDYVPVEGGSASVPFPETRVTALVCPTPTTSAPPATDTPVGPTNTPTPTDTPVIACGDGLRQGVEQCDDGNLINGDGCENDCTLSGACSLPASEGDEIFVGDGLSGSDPGCATPAFAAIQAAIDAAADGDTISVCPGVYNEALVIGSELVLRSTDGAAVTSIDSGAAITVDIRRSGTTVEGFTLLSTGVTVSANAICPLASPGCATPGEAGSNISIRDNVIAGAATGIEWRGKIDCAAITGNALADNAQHVLLRQEHLTATPAILVEVSNNTCDGGGTAGIGVEVFGMQAQMSTNRVSDAAAVGVRIGGAVVRWTTGVVERSAVAGILVEQAPVGTQILESEIVDNAGDGITVGAGGEGARILNNNIQRNGVGLANNTSTGTVDATLNYWDSFTGPFHAALRDFGLGDPIVDAAGAGTEFVEFLCDRFPQGFPSEEGVCGAESSTLLQLIPGSWPDITFGKGRYIAFESPKHLDIDPRTSFSNSDERSEAFILDRYPRRRLGGICIGDPGLTVCKKNRDCPPRVVGNGLVLTGECGLFTQISDDSDAASFVQRVRLSRNARIVTFDRSVLGGVEPEDGAAMDWTKRTFERVSPVAALEPLTSGAGGLSQRPNPNLSGRKIVVESTENLTGDNADGNWEIFLFDSRNGWIQLTDTQAPVENLRPELRAGIRVVFDSTGDLDNDPSTTLSNADGNREIFVLKLGSRDRLVFTQVTDTAAPVENVVGCAARGGRHIFFSSNADLDNDAKTNAANGDGNREIFRFIGTARGRTFTQVTDSSGGENANPSCTPNGVWLAFESTADLENDGATNRRIYLANLKKKSLLRLSRSRFGDNAHPRTTGRMTVWDSNANLTGANPEAERVIYLFDRRKD